MTDETNPDTPPVDAAPDAQDPVADTAAVAGNPSLEEAQAMFADNPGLAAVLTDRGTLTRDGVLIPVATGE